jgi:hypothetical protein
MKSERDGIKPAVKPSRLRRMPGSRRMVVPSSQMRQMRAHRFRKIGDPAKT